MTDHTTQLFAIPTGSSEPIYRQLVEQVRRLLAGGRFASASMLLVQAWICCMGLAVVRWRALVKAPFVFPARRMD